MNGIVAVLAVVTAVDVAQRVRQLRDRPPGERAVLAAGFLAAALVLAAVATPLLDALDISAPNLQIGAGVVLAVYSAVALVRWDDTPALARTASGRPVPIRPLEAEPASAATKQCGGRVRAAPAEQARQNPAAASGRAFPPEPLVPLLFPIVLTPAVGVVVMAVAARNGLLVPLAATAGVAIVLAWPAVDGVVGRRPVRLLSATLGVVAGAVMVVDGAFAV